ncbi:MAG: DUF3866 family protein [Solirubrobacterales bacterium]|nr:DUF3866 family protein [Solirubrobacterales bacterium]
MLKLRRGTVVEESGDGMVVVEVDGERRRAWADESMVGPAAVGDDVVVNTAALDLGLGSGGYDIVHANLTRGLAGGETEPGVHVMKLNYSSLQHAVDPIEAPADAPSLPERTLPVLVLPLHGHLAPAAWAAAGAGARAGFVQAGGGGLPGGLSRDLRTLLDRGLIAGSTTASPSYGGEHEAISLIGALHAAAGLDWDAVIVGPGPGILGSSTRYGHGGMAALDAAHSALALGLPTIVSPRMSSGDPRPRHLGLSHHTRSVLELLLGGVEVPVPVGLDELWPLAAGEATPVLEEASGGLHRIHELPVDLPAYAETGLPQRTMGRTLDEDRLFFAAPLAAGRALAEAV